MAMCQNGRDFSLTTSCTGKRNAFVINERSVRNVRLNKSVEAQFEGQLTVRTNNLYDIQFIHNSQCHLCPTNVCFVIQPCKYMCTL